MRSVRLAAVLFGAAILFTPGPSRADAGPGPAEMDERLDALFGAHEPFHAFFDQLQKLAAEGDKAAIATLVAYPFETEVDKKKTVLKSEADFTASYDKLFTPGVLKEIEQQTYETLFARDQGVMIGGGSVWFAASCADDECKTLNPVKIIAINQTEE